MNTAAGMLVVVLAFLVPTASGFLVEMVPFEPPSIKMEDFESKYSEQNFPVRMMCTFLSIASHHGMTPHYLMPHKLMAPQVMIKEGAADWKATRWGIDGLLSKCGDRKLNKCKTSRKKVHPRFKGWVRRPVALKPVNITDYSKEHKEELKTLEDLVQLQRKGSQLHYLHYCQSPTTTDHLPISIPPLYPTLHLPLQTLFRA